MDVRSLKMRNLILDDKTSFTDKINKFD